MTRGEVPLLCAVIVERVNVKRPAVVLKLWHGEGFLVPLQENFLKRYIEVSGHGITSDG